jgi:SAM-dependent MidA family methyltransferase
MSAAAYDPAPPPSPAFLEAFRARADSAGRLPFDEFMALALYHPELGYYRQNRPRVGRSADTDFFTATSSGPLFGELVCAACVKLLGENDPAAFTFVEIGAEPDGGLLKNVRHPFACAKTIRIGQPIQLTGRLIVFSNELFDAQPFRRFIARDGRWHELGVRLTAENLLTETELDVASSPLAHPLSLSTVPTPLSLPAAPRAGYRLDLPLAAAALADAIAAQPWTGLFVAFDYGKSWRELAEATPAGTARAYHRHAQSNDLLARPGGQDLTCHICWDWLADALARHGFSPPAEQSQESFFVHHAGEFIGATVAAEATRLSARKQSLLQLLHPGNLGQKFQVLHALRQ